MRILALFAECVSLLNAETVLLVGYDEREGLELNIRLDYCVSADEQVDFARFERTRVVSAFSWSSKI